MRYSAAVCCISLVSFRPSHAIDDDDLHHRPLRFEFQPAAILNDRQQVIAGKKLQVESVSPLEPGVVEDDRFLLAGEKYREHPHGQVIVVETPGTVDLADRGAVLLRRRALRSGAGGREFSMGNGASNTLGSTSKVFNHNIVMQAGNDISLDSSIYQGVRDLTLAADASFAFSTGQTVASNGAGNVTLLGNHTISTGGNVNVSGINFSLLGGDTGGGGANQLLSAAGTINLMNSGVILVKAGTSTVSQGSGAKMTASTGNEYFSKACTRLWPKNANDVCNSTMITRPTNGPIPNNAANA